jgi:hypothetical protein
MQLIKIGGLNRQEYEEAILMRKNAQLSVRITEQEMMILREQANRECVLLSQLIRNMLAANSNRIGPDQHRGR